MPTVAELGRAIKTKNPGKYDDLCTQARNAAEAEGAVLIIARGNRGSGFSVQGPIELHATLPEVLDQMAAQIRSDWSAADNSVVSEYQSAAYALLTLGKATGALSRDDVQRYIIDSLRNGRLSKHYLITLRDRLDDVLRAAEAASSAAPNGDAT